PNVFVPQAELKGYASQNLDIVWPTVRSGKTSGVLSLYVSIDTSGRVRETFPLNSDNAGLVDDARKQVEQWRFKPWNVNGTPYQVESLLTFAFSTKIDNPVPVLTDAEVRKLATHIVEPRFPPGAAPSGTALKIRVAVDANGKLMGVENPYKAPSSLFMA